MVCALGLVSWLFGLAWFRAAFAPEVIEREVQADQQAWQFGYDLRTGYMATIKAAGKWRVFARGARVWPGGHDEIAKASAIDGYVQSGANRGCLLVRSGDNSILAFSQDDETIEITTPGRIYFCCNDERTTDGAKGTRRDNDAIPIPATVTNRLGFADNTGAVKVTITVKKAP